MLKSGISVMEYVKPSHTDVIEYFEDYKKKIGQKGGNREIPGKNSLTQFSGYVTMKVSVNISYSILFKICYSKSLDYFS